MRKSTSSWAPMCHYFFMCLFSALINYFTSINYIRIQQLKLEPIYYFSQLCGKAGQFLYGSCLDSLLFLHSTGEVVGQEGPAWPHSPVWQLVLATDWTALLLHLTSQSPVSSVQFSCSVMSDSLQPYEPQHARPPCPSPTPGVHPKPCPLSR